jgi:hypothetical protein
MTISQIQPAAFTLRPDAVTPSEACYGLHFPSDWRSIFIQLEHERQGEQRDRVTFPIRTLNATLTALSAQFVTMPGQAPEPKPEDDSPEPWLLARQRIPPDRLALIVQAWCNETFAECPSLETVQRDTLIRASDLSWFAMTPSFEAPRAANGTANPDRSVYTVLPAYLADLLVRRGTTVQVYGTPQQLVRVPTQNGAEVMSWPPVRYRDSKGKEGWYSYVITLTVQTMVGQPDLRVHAHYGVRRWVASPLLEGNALYLKATARSVFLRTTEDWLGMPAGPMFTRAMIQATSHENQRVPEWTNLLPGIAQRLQIAWPSARDLTIAPLSYLNDPGIDGVVAGIVEHTPRYHAVKQGVGLDDHEALTKVLADALQDHLALVPPLTRPTQTRQKKEKHPLEKNLRDLPRKQRLAALADSVAPELTIEIRWTTPALRNMLVDRILAMLCSDRPALLEQAVSENGIADNGDMEGVYPADEELDEELLEQLEAFDLNGAGDLVEEEEEEAGEPDSLEVPERRRSPARKRAPEPEPAEADGELWVQIPGGRLRIMMQPLDSIGGLFPAPIQALNNKAARNAYVRDETTRRAEEVQQQMPPVTEPTLTIIELPNYRDPRIKGSKADLRRRDPKRALRLGAARAGRITKFLAPEADGDLREKCRNTVLEGLRQLGYLPEPIGLSMREPNALPTDMIVAGVWMVRLTEKRGFVKVHLPLVVLFHTARRKVRAWIPDGKGTRPFHQVLLDMTTLDSRLVQRNNQKVALRQLESFLSHDIYQEGARDVLVLVEAQNMRQTLTGFQNPFTMQDMLRLSRDKEGMPLDKLGGRLRIVRLRSSERNETPEWYTPGAGPGRGYTQGVWVEPDASPGDNRLFYSLAYKPLIMSRGRKGKQAAPNELYANPSLLEVLLVALQQGDEPESWSFAVDTWRKMSYLTGDMTLFPLPLQWAENCDRYAAVIGPWVLGDQWDEGEDEEEDGVVQLSLW